MAWDLQPTPRKRHLHSPLHLLSLWDHFGSNFATFLRYAMISVFAVHTNVRHQAWAMSLHKNWKTSCIPSQPEAKFWLLDSQSSMLANKPQTSVNSRLKLWSYSRGDLLFKTNKQNKKHNYTVILFYKDFFLELWPVVEI